MLHRIAASLMLGACCLVGCQQEPPRQAAEPASPRVQAPVPEDRPPTDLPRATKACNIRDDAAANEPFGTELTPAELQQLGGRVIGREPIENNHLPEQIDTLITVEHRANRFTFYRSPERDLLTQAYLTEFDVPYGRELQKRLQAARQRQSAACDSLYIQDHMQLNTVVASLHNGELRRVFVEPYFD